MQKKGLQARAHAAVDAHIHETPACLSSAPYVITRCCCCCWTCCWVHAHWRKHMPFSPLAQMRREISVWVTNLAACGLQKALKPFVDDTILFSRLGHSKIFFTAHWLLKRNSICLEELNSKILHLRKSNLQSHKIKFATVRVCLFNINNVFAKLQKSLEELVKLTHFLKIFLGKDFMPIRNSKSKWKYNRLLLKID
jgi:hypothetical protein